MNIDLKSLIMPVVILLLALCAWHYHGAYSKASSDLNLATATITDMQTRQRDIAALDTKYTKELADAKAANDTLRDDVNAGRKRLLIKTTGVCKAPASTGVDSGGTSELAESGRQDYNDLRSMIALQDKQLRGAQEYINTQCLK